jgi:Holliday junction resolvase RusA-like endonuclease
VIAAAQFVVVGNPEPQGSTKAFVVKGRAVTTSANTRLKPWRTEVTLAARAAMLGAAGPFPLVGAVTVHAAFAVRRPKSVRRRYPIVKPDLDKLQRAIGDALVDAGLIKDDCQIVGWNPTKRYQDDPESQLPGHPGVRVTVFALEDK